jgi:DNA segregation ATPase FtsK/SpoIIIE, S-DNA-T family
VAQISISDIRREIIRTAGYVRPAAALSNPIVGSLFHEVLARLMGTEGWQAALEPDELGDASRLVAHTYEKLLGPRLTESHANLSEYGGETLVLWQAIQSMCRWLSDLLKAASQRSLIQYDPKARAWLGAERLCRPEFPLQWEVREPHWTAPVLVSGVADAFWLDPESGRWCVVEYKLGQGNPEADLAQACLYHAILAGTDFAPSDGALSIFWFCPELKQRFYSSAELQSAQASLRALIGRLAGVIQETSPGVPPPKPESAAPSPAHVELGKQLVRALRDYGVSVQWSGEVTVGPTFLRYPVMPGRDVKKKAITDRAAELQMQLQLEQPPFIDLAKGRLVIDVQRPDRQTVSFSSISGQIPRPRPAGNSQIPLGVDLNGKLQFVDLASPNNPHLLVAGTSGSGKSEWLRMAVAGMTVSNTPETLRLVLIDPKRNAFSELKGSRYLFGNKGLIYPPEDRAMDTLELLIEEMEDRYRRFSKESVSDLAEYVAKTGEGHSQPHDAFAVRFVQPHDAFAVRPPRIVCVCDEYADLVADRSTKKEVEGAINRLGAKARAAGIHLIIATQYPDRNTVGGALKMNLGGRVCLRTTSHIQSNMIINQSGAERLLGKGDLFFLSIGEPVRLQAPYLSPEERAQIFGGEAALCSSGGPSDTGKRLPSAPFATL